MIKLETITAIITQHGYGDADKCLARLKAACYGGDEGHIKIKNGSYMPLTIEYIGEVGPDKLPLLSIAHYYEQNGDLMRDPDVTLAVEGGGYYSAVSFRQDGGFPVDQEAVFERDGVWYVKRRAQQDIELFAAQWDRNLAAQGFLIAQQAAQTMAVAS